MNKPRAQATGYAKNTGQEREQQIDYAVSPSALATTAYTIPMPPREKSKPEIEIKLRITNIPEILHKIKRLRAIPQHRVQEQNTLYDTPESHLRRRKMLLRLRIETPAPQNAPTAAREERVILTSKAPPQDQATRLHTPRYKIRAEREQVASMSSLHYAKALTSLGFRPTFRYDKFRTSFRLPSLHLDLDETPAGIYLELEGSPKAIDSAAKALGFTKKAYLRATYWDLYAAACRRRGTKPKNMLFAAK
jgi:adenylate cyclase, class 2